MATDNSQLEAARQQVNDVQNVMQSNVNKLMEREGKLSQLEERADQLQVGCIANYRSKSQNPQGSPETWDSETPKLSVSWWSD